MSRSTGRTLRVSRFRHLVTDLMHFSAKVPSACMERRINLARVRAARQACTSRPNWTAIFTKAFGIVAARIPELRQSYMPLPWAHLYEHSRSIASMNVEREYQGETVVLQSQIRSPENRSLEQLDAIVRNFKEAPIEEVKCYGRILRLAKLPWPLRRFVWWTGLNLFGRLRVHNFGTFGITTVAAEGAGIQRITPILTATLHYSLFDDADSLEMRLSIDHRVLDGATAARALVSLEKVLHQEILDELLNMRALRAA